MTAYEAKHLVKKEQHRLDLLVIEYLVAHVFDEIKKEATKGNTSLSFYVEDAEGVEVNVFCNRLQIKLQELGYRTVTTQTFFIVSW